MITKIEYDQRKLVLTQIVNHVLDEMGPYHLSLSSEEKGELRVVIAGLIEIADDISNIRIDRDGHVNLAQTNPTLRRLLGEKPLPFHVNNFSSRRHVRNYLEKPNPQKKEELKNKITAIKSDDAKEVKITHEVYFNKIDELFAIAEEIYTTTKQYDESVKEDKPDNAAKDKIYQLGLTRDALIKDLLSDPLYREVFLDGLNDAVREKRIVENTIDQFITQFNKVKLRGPDKVKKFISLLGGNCLDGRMRAAFDYSYKLDEYYFSSTLKQCIDAIPSKDEEKTYFQIAAKLMSHHAWGHSYASEGVYFDPGDFNESCFPHLDAFLKNFALEPELDFVNEADYAVQGVKLAKEKFREEMKQEKASYTWDESKLNSFLAFVYYNFSEIIPKLTELKPEKYAAFVSIAMEYGQLGQEAMLVLLSQLTDEHFYSIYPDYFARLAYEDLPLFADLTKRLWDIFNSKNLNERQKLFSMIDQHKPFLATKKQFENLHHFIAKTGKKEQIPSSPQNYANNSNARVLSETIIVAAEFHNWDVCQLLLTHLLIECNSSRENWKYKVLVLMVNDAKWELAACIIDLIEGKKHEPSLYCKQNVFMYFLSNYKKIEEKMRSYLHPFEEREYRYIEYKKKWEIDENWLGPPFQMIFSAFTQDEIKKLMQPDLIKQLLGFDFSTYPQSWQTLRDWLTPVVNYCVQPDRDFSELRNLFYTKAIDVSYLTAHLMSLLQDPTKRKQLLAMKCDSDHVNYDYDTHYYKYIDSSTTILHQLAELRHVDKDFAANVFQSLFDSDALDSHLIALPSGMLKYTFLTHAMYSDFGLFEFLLKKLLERTQSKPNLIRQLLREFDIDEPEHRTKSTLEHILTHASTKPLTILLYYVSRENLVFALKSYREHKGQHDDTIYQANLLEKARDAITPGNYKLLMKFLGDAIFDVIQEGVGALPVSAAKKKPEILTALLQLAGTADAIEVKQEPTKTFKLQPYKSLELTKHMHRNDINSYKAEIIAVSLAELISTQPGDAATLLENWPSASFNSLGNRPGSNYFNLIANSLGTVSGADKCKLFHTFFTKLSKSNFYILACNIDEIKISHWHTTAIIEDHFKLAIIFREHLFARSYDGYYLKLPKQHLYRELICLLIHPDSNSDNQVIAIKKMLVFITSKGVSTVINTLSKDAEEQQVKRVKKIEESQVLLNLFIPLAEPETKTQLLQARLAYLLDEVCAFKNKHPSAIDNNFRYPKDKIIDPTDSKVDLNKKIRNIGNSLLDLVNHGLVPEEMIRQISNKSPDINVDCKKILGFIFKKLPAELQLWWLSDCPRLMLLTQLRSSIQSLLDKHFISADTLNRLCKRNIDVLLQLDQRYADAFLTKDNLEIRRDLDLSSQKQSSSLSDSIATLKSLIANGVNSYDWRDIVVNFYGTLEGRTTTQLVTPLHLQQLADLNWLAQCLDDKASPEQKTSMKEKLDSYKDDTDGKLLRLHKTRYQLLEQCDNYLQSMASEIRNLPPAKLDGIILASEKKKNTNLTEAEVKDDIFTIARLFTQPRIPRIELHFSALPSLAKKFGNPVFSSVYTIYVLMKTLDHRIETNDALIASSIKQFTTVISSESFKKNIAQVKSTFGVYKPYAPGADFIKNCLSVLKNEPTSSINLDILVPSAPVATNNAKR